MKLRNLEKTPSRNMAERKALNDHLAEVHGDYIREEMVSGIKTMRQIAQETGLSEHRIRDIAMAAGVDLDQRRIRVKNAKLEQQREDKIADIIRTLRHDSSARNLNISSLARRFHCSVYLIDEVFQRIGSKPGDKTDCARSATLDAGMAGDLSRGLLAARWVQSTTPRCFYY